MRLHTNTQQQQAHGRKWVRPAVCVSAPVQSMRAAEGAGGSRGPSGSREEHAKRTHVHALHVAPDQSERGLAVSAVKYLPSEGLFVGLFKKKKKKAGNALFNLPSHLGLWMWISKESVILALEPCLHKP